MDTQRKALGRDEDQRSLLHTMPEDHTVTASASKQQDMETHQCHASEAAVPGAKNSNGELEGEFEEDNTCADDRHPLSQADLRAVRRSNMTSKSVTLEEKGVRASVLAAEPKKRKVDKTDGGSRLKLPRKRKADLTDSGHTNEEKVSGGTGVSLKRNRAIPLGADPQSRKYTKKLKTVLGTKHSKQPKLKQAAVSSPMCQRKKQEAKSHDVSMGISETSSQGRRNNRREKSAITSTVSGNVSMGDFGESSQSKSERRNRQSGTTKVAEAVDISLVDGSQRRGRDRSVLCTACSSRTRTRRRTKKSCIITPSNAKSHVDDASRSKPQRRKKQKASERNFRLENDNAISAINVTEPESQGWAVILDAHRSQTEWADTSLHDAVDSNGLRNPQKSSRNSDKHGDSACSSKWERGIRPRKTDYLEPGTLSPRLLSRPDATYHDVVAGETVLVNHIDHDPCKWEATDEVELVACQDGNTPHGYRDASGGICRLYRQYLDIVNGEVLRQVACELWEYAS